MTTAEAKSDGSPHVPAPENASAPVTKDVVEEKPVTDQKALDSPVKKTSLDRDVALAQVETEKRLSFIKAWEETEKTKVENKAEKDLAAIATWENTKKADVEAKLKKKEEELEKLKADYAEKMKNKIALIHKDAEEKRALAEAKRAEEILKAEESAAKFRATGLVPKTGMGCFG